MKREELEEGFAEVKRLTGTGAHAEAARILFSFADPDMDFPTVHRMARLLRTIQREAWSRRTLRLALVSSETLEHFSGVLQFFLAKEGLACEIFLSRFGTLEQTLLDPTSELHSFRADILWIFSSHRDLRGLPSPGAPVAEVGRALEEEFARFRSMWEAAARHSGAAVLQNNADTPLERVFGHFEAAAPWSRATFLRRFNAELPGNLVNGVSVFDFDHVASMFGRLRWFDDRFWYHSKHAFALDACALVAFEGARVIRGMLGLARKCAVLDLDNTLWGGVIGDDGLEGIRIGDGADGEAHADLQQYLLELRRRGVVLAVSSKNEDAAARLPFEKHPDMRLRIGDIAVFRANWDNKADNLRLIAETLDLGLDSFVFLDDNPAERDLVRRELPQVAVPELPKDPSHYRRILDRERYFETAAFTEEDSKRAEMYTQNARRAELRSSATSLPDFLRGLAMVATVSPMDAFILPRTAQLINKSNQFHLTATRYSESRLREMVAGGRVHGLTFRLRDRFGDNGLICAVLAEQIDPRVLSIDTWVMSCRVLSRGMEEFTLNEIILLASRLSCKRILGRYQPTAKNNLVARLYERLGFVCTESEPDGATSWAMDIPDPPRPLPVFIEKETKE